MTTESVLLLFVLIILIYTGVGLLAASKREAYLGDMSDLDDVEDETKAKSKLENQLLLLNITLSPLQYCVGILLIASISGLLILEFFPASYIISGLLVVVICFSLASIVKELAAWKIRRFERDLVEALDLLKSALQAGETPQGAIRIVSEIANGDIKKEFKALSEGLDLGLPISRAIARISELYDSETVRMFTQVLIAKWQVGGDFTVLINSISRVIRERVMLRNLVSGQLSGIRYASFFMAAIPYLLIPFFLYQQPTWLNIIINHEYGPKLLIGAFLIQIVSFFWLRRILRVS